MKIQNLTLVALCLFLPFSAHSQDVEAVEVPTEVSEPPYEVGDLVTEQGYYIDPGKDQPKINLRIVGNKFHLYWIDENGLIAEPEFQKAVARLTGSVRGRPYHNLTPLPGGAGLGSPGLVVPPHIYNVALVLIPADEGAEPITHSFRYTAAFDIETDPTAVTGN